MRALSILLGAAVLSVWTAPAASQAPGDLADVLDSVMQDTGSQGIAAAVVEDGEVVALEARGKRNTSGAALDADTVMYGASLTKTAFAYMMLQLVDDGRIDLDRSIADYLPRPLTDCGSDEIEDRYARYSDLTGDERWRALTPRILLSHGSGFANFAFLEPDGKLRFHSQPGSRYAYSGDGIMLLQFVLEEGLGLDVGIEMQRRVFDRFGMTRTSMTWWPDFAANLADGWTQEGEPEPHDERSRTRAAGSMDTTLSDVARLTAAISRGEGLSPAMRSELTRPQLPIRTRSQFPTLQPDLPVQSTRSDLASGLGVIAFTSPQGPGWYNGGHNDSTGNTLVCLERPSRCVVVLSNDVRSERGFEQIVHAALGEAGVPWSWGDGFEMLPNDQIPE